MHTLTAASILLRHANIKYKSVHISHQKTSIDSNQSITTTSTQLSNRSNTNIVYQLAMSTTSKPIVKSLPQFNPTYYLAWASDVRDAFEDRGWTSYLIAPTTSEPNTTAATDTSTTSTFQPDPVIVNKARAFLKAAIPYEYKHGLETFTTAAEIWIALEQRYASTSREDELRLKSQLMDLRKSKSDTIDQHIQKYSAILSSVLAQQQPDRRFDTPEMNSYFLRSLENSNIPDEDWKGFITFLGKSWLTATKEQLYSDARTYYNTHIQPHLTEPASNDSKVLAIRNTPQANRSATAISTSPQTIAIIATIVAIPITITIATTIATAIATAIATVIAITIPDRAQHHRVPISGATIIDVLTATALPNAKPNSWIRNTCNSNNKVSATST